MSRINIREGISTLHVFNVGQGDSILIEFINGETMIVDCCIPPNEKESPTLRYLRSNKIHNIDILCLTHPDRDHYNGMVQLIDWIQENGGEIRNFILFGGPELKELKSRIQGRLKDIEDSGLEMLNKRFLHQTLKRELIYLSGLFERIKPIAHNIIANRRIFKRADGFSHIQTFDEARVYLLGPDSFTNDSSRESALNVVINMMLSKGNDKEHSSDNTNEVSCILWVILRDVSILLPGDAGKATFLQSIEIYEKNHKSEVGKDINSQIVQVSHHGSKYCSSKEIWNKITHSDGTYAVISAGANNIYRHPHEETLQHILKCDSHIDVYYTNICPVRLASLEIKKIIPLRERDSFQEDSIGLEDSNDIFLDDYRCHGDCKFEISYKGEITPVPQFNRGKCWYLNKDCNTQNDLCFE